MEILLSKKKRQRLDRMPEHQTQSEDRSVSVGGDLVGSAVVTGDNNIVSVVYQTLTGKEAVEQADSLRNLQLLLSKVKTFWISGVLEQSMDGRALPIKKLTQHQSVQRPFEGQLQQISEQDQQTLVEKVASSFDDSGRTLLILGQPGAGKTMTLLELARDLVFRAEQNVEHPIPVVFLLSSWPGPQVSLEKWIRDELSVQYQIPRDIGEIWLKRKKLLPLLDGLDEVDSQQQASCVEAIHSLLEQVGVPGLAVSSRAEDYRLLPARLKLGGAICLQPLTDEQIRQCITDGTIKSKQLNELLNKHQTLRQVVQSPLMFEIVTSAFDDSADVSQNVSLESEPDCRAFLFDAYIDHVLKMDSFTTSESSAPPLEQNENGWFLDRLSWLAKQLIEQQKSIFQLEEIQPSWLGSDMARWLNMVIVSLVVGFATGAAVLFASMGLAPILTALKLDPLAHFELLIQVSIWMMVVGHFDFFSKRKASVSRHRVATIGQVALQTCVYFLIWMIWPLAFLLMAHLSNGQSIKDWFTYNALTGLVVCTFFASISRNRRLTIDIHTVEALAVSSKKAIHGAMLGAVCGMAVYWLYFTLVPTEQYPFFWKDPVEMYSIISYPVCGALAGLVIGGIVPRIDNSKVTINQGIRLTQRNALITGLGSTIFCAIPGILMLILARVTAIKDYSMSQCILGGLGFGVLIGFFTCFWFGGLSIIQHYVLRIHLAAKGMLPWNVAKFTSRGIRLRLLQRVGGGYLFVHGLLREHLANRKAATESEE